MLSFFLPPSAFANGGGLLFLLLNTAIFVVGQIWIICAEIFIYKSRAKLNTKESILQVIGVNVTSTIVVGLGFPLAMAVIGGVGSFLPEPLGPYFFLLGTWVVDKVPYNMKLLPYVMAFRFIVTYFNTVHFEAWCLKNYWRRKNKETAISAKKFSWYANTFSYAGLISMVGAYYLITKN